MPLVPAELACCRWIMSQYLAFVYRKSSCEDHMYVMKKYHEMPLATLGTRLELCNI
ncbi:uncharacterized protein PHALS_02855 [Plasmopara halstedii]|uniref:Uncharacterized protein n=1 Tax=Plasmopara halstedii TaxID=4781 RepID=A0A0P1AYT2_PLAHL|nr:uncharacterized protein PHALS_02855 [Plasmopara halstedii]CEG46454.1 hypothetical protein PHALS_02855 [Plasmopara halstedii]|eukprot:XP_024582823.1 hypothetical protein PHALS_02855 [Plasmopara halstedii]